MKRWIGMGIVLIFTSIILAVAQEEYSPPTDSPADTSASTAIYVGVEKCRMCHPSYYKDYKKRNYTKAWKVLKMKGKDRDPVCLECHSTGYGQPGGYVDENTTPHLKYKQCEACHGPGSKHVDNSVDMAARQEMKDYLKRPDTCTACHKCVFTHMTAVEEF